MKYTIVVAALLGFFSAETTQGKNVMLGHEGRLAFLNELIQEDSESESSSEEDVQLKLTAPPEYGEVPAFMDGAEANGGYERFVKPQYTLERDDRLMHSLITKYAREITVDGKLTGHMFLNKEDALAVSKEVVGTHLGYDSKKTLSYLNGNGEDSAIFEDTWNHFDVNKDGLVEVERMPQFLRMILGNSLEINLQ